MIMSDLNNIVKERRLSQCNQILSFTFL